MLAGDFVRIAPDVKLGQDVKIYAFANLYGCEIGDESKIGASIGSNATILCGLTIGEEAIVGAGSVVTHDVAPRTIVAGNPAHVIQHIKAISGVAP